MIYKMLSHASLHLRDDIMIQKQMRHNFIFKEISLVNLGIVSARVQISSFKRVLNSNLMLAKVSIGKVQSEEEGPYLGCRGSRIPR